MMIMDKAGMMTMEIHTEVKKITMMTMEAGEAEEEEEVVKDIKEKIIMTKTMTTIPMANRKEERTVLIKDLWDVGYN